ncbi:zinc finger with KRAB and SCAN domains 7-like, partial [Paramuricea clavata]
MTLFPVSSANEVQSSDEVCATTSTGENDLVLNEASSSNENMSKDDQVSQSSEISQTDQNLISSSDAVQHGDIMLDHHTQPPMSSGDAIAHEIVTTSEDGSNSQTLYVAIQPPGGNHGDMSHDQPAVYLEVVESGNLSEQITSAGQVLEGQMIIQQATSTTGGTTVVPASSILTVDQDTLSTMQAEMIAVQVLSQSGDVQLFQNKPGSTTQVVPVTTISSGDLQALTQANLVTSSMSAVTDLLVQSSSGTSLTAVTTTGTEQDNAGVSTTTDITIDTSGSSDALQAVSTTGDDEIEAAQVESEENAGDDETMIVEEEKTAEDALPGELEKPKYTCEICGKAYIRSWSFYGHMREHASGDKQHKCSVCEKVFNYASNLRQHMLIHT